ncbi:MAG TPA: hypothetical protein VFW18_08195 [Gaiellales bacterium]|nr:hypothetical protein [Gaiellales bacterium]
MIWLSWRQQRLEALLGAGVLAALAALLILTGRHIDAFYNHAHLAACGLGRPQPSSCGDSVTHFTIHYASLVNLTSWFNMVPLLIGILVAAPIVLDFEQGTHRLAWTQTITSRRWLTTRLTLAGTLAVLAAVAFTLVMTWWRGPFDALSGRFDTSAFDFEGIVPIAYTLFAASVVLAVGTILRRTLPAVAIAIVSFLALRLGIEGWVRYQHYLHPLTRTWPVGTTAPPGEANGYTTSSGLSFGGPPGAGRQVIHACNVTQTDPRRLQAISSCLHHHHVLQYAIYQPASRFWTFQGIEASIFLALTLALVAISVWWASHRLA